MGMFKKLFDKSNLERYIEKIFKSMAIGEGVLEYMCRCREVDNEMYGWLVELYKEALSDPAFGDNVDIRWVRWGVGEISITSVGKYVGFLLVNVKESMEGKNFVCILKSKRVDEDP